MAPVLSDAGRFMVRTFVADGEFSPNTARLTACRPGDTVADGEVWNALVIHFYFLPPLVGIRFILGDT